MTIKANAAATQKAAPVSAIVFLATLCIIFALHLAVTKHKQAAVAPSIYIYIARLQNNKKKEREKCL